MTYTYLYINLASVFLPFAFSFEKRVHFYSYWRALFPALLLSAIPFLAWDQFFAAEGIWGFNEQYILSRYIGMLPVEEILFFIAIPYSSIFIYASLNSFFPNNNFFNKTASFWNALFLVLALAGILLFYDRWYTVVNCTFAAVVLSLQIFWIKGTYIGRFWRFYFVHLIPFFIVNGILTGTWLPEPVVWYNDAENMGVRIGTVPMEDTMYSLSLMLINITWMEYFLRRKFVSNAMAD